MVHLLWHIGIGSPASSMRERTRTQQQPANYNYATKPPRCLAAYAIQHTLSLSLFLF